MVPVYALFSEKHNKMYIRMTTNLKMRIFDHNNLPKGWTQSIRPWKLVYTKEFCSKQKV